MDGSGIMGWDQLIAPLIERWRAAVVVTHCTHHIPSWNGNGWLNGMGRWEGLNSKTDTAMDACRA